MISRRVNIIWLYGILFFSVLISGCQTLPEDAFKLAPTSLEDRQLQSRKFNTVDHKLLLSAGASVLQDLGYNIDEANTALGVLTASKKADATEGSQVAMAIVAAILTGTITPIDDEQDIRICLVVHESLDDPSSSIARITIQRVIWNTEEKISRVESIKEPEIYQGFFDKLSKGAFLEANEI